ncbi:MAG: hypothetical protein AMS16_00985 [Planctomycetes bacterium DG_58]|nr:MAG: hypothetical protein AMS16_00985 [Planctomycetes bacterium DG_58]
MIQCKDCEFCEIGPDGSIKLNCHPFQTIKEPECLTKWQLLKLDTMVRAYMATVAHYKKLAPLQEKMMKAVEREIEEMEEGEQWKYGPTEEEEEEEEGEEESERDDELL